MRPVLRVGLTFGIMGIALGAPTLSFGQQQGPVLAAASDTTVRQLIQLRDGSTVLGRITQSWGDSARVETLAGVLVIRRTDVTALRDVALSSIHNGVYWPDDPNATRLFFAPTARMLRKGEGYLANHWLFLMDGHWGITDRFTMGGAMTLVPTTDFLKNNAYFLSPKISITQSEHLHTAAGVWIGAAPFSSDGNAVNSFGIAYGVATWGTRDAAITLGSGYGFAEGKLARNPLVMVGGTKRLSKRWALVTENWVFPNVEDHPIVSLGFRGIGESISWDFGLVTILGTDAFIPIPWFGASWKF